MSVRLTERDRRLLGKCASARWLSTSQIRRLFFARASPNAVRKRLRKLALAGYLRLYQPHRMSEALHAVGSAGKQALALQGVDVSAERQPPKQREHLWGINELRVWVESGGVAVRFFFASWELGKFGWTSPVIPDAVFGIASAQPLTFVAEYDRGTETVDRFAKNLLRYRREPEGFSFDAVLVITNTDARLANIGRALRRRGIETARYLGATLRVTEAGGPAASVFVDLGDAAGKTHSLLGLGR